MSNFPKVFQEYFLKWKINRKKIKAHPMIELTKIKHGYVILTITMLDEHDQPVIVQSDIELMEGGKIGFPDIPVVIHFSAE